MKECRAYAGERSATGRAPLMLLRELGADVEAKGVDGATPLHLAVRRHATEMIAVLVKELGAMCVQRIIRD